MSETGKENVTAARPAADDVILLDGGTGSELRRRGVALTSDVWSAAANLGHADTLIAIHRDYIEAGADIVTANTFAATRIVLAAADLDDRVAAINRSAIEAAFRARDEASVDRNVTIAASLSCYPPGNDPDLYPDAEEELDAYRESIRLFEEAGAELILVEMMQDTKHASLACQAAAESGQPFWLGLSCRRDPGSGQLVGFDLPGADFAATLEALLVYGPAAVNIMHTPVDDIGAALRALRERWNGRFGVYPEIPYAADPDLKQGAIGKSGLASGYRTGMSPAGLAHHAAAWIEHGSTIIGGCCGTTPAHIAALRQLLGDFSSR